MTFDPHGPRCNCGSYGCIERYLGARYLSAQAREEVGKGSQSIISHLVHGNLDAITPYVLTQAANKGDLVARELWQRAGERLGIVLAGVVNLVNPEIIVLSGGGTLSSYL